MRSSNKLCDYDDSCRFKLNDIGFVGLKGIEYTAILSNAKTHER